jgi:thioredoxin 1
MTTSTAVSPLTAATFDEVVQAADVPVLVDFWADWCGPCRILDPILEGLASELEGRLRIVSVDADAHPALAGRFHVLSLPTLLVFVDGEPVKRMVGARGRGHLLEELDDLLS